MSEPTKAELFRTALSMIPESVRATLLNTYRVDPDPTGVLGGGLPVKTEILILLTESLRNAIRDEANSEKSFAQPISLQMMPRAAEILLDALEAVVSRNLRAPPDPYPRNLKALQDFARSAIMAANYGHAFYKPLWDHAADLCGCHGEPCPVKA